MHQGMKQRIRYAEASDGLSLAWAEAGMGMPLVRAATWLTHLEYDWQSPVWRHWSRFFAEHFHYVRHDERGCGMTDWRVDDLSYLRSVEDLETVVEAADPDGPIALLGISQGASTAIAYAARHPRRVSHLILYGGYARGVYKRGNTDAVSKYNAVTELIRQGWDSSNPVFRQLFTSRFIPDGDNEQLGWFNELCRRTTSPEAGAALMKSHGEIDASEFLSQVRVPTLVLHAGDDQIVSLSEGKRLAQHINGASFVQLDSRNHILLEHEPAWAQFKLAVLAFTGVGVAPSQERLQGLTTREREILRLLCQGLSNSQIGCKLHICEKTVRNHATHLYEKLGVHSRTAAMALVQGNQTSE